MTPNFHYWLNMDRIVSESVKNKRDSSWHVREISRGSGVAFTYCSNAYLLGSFIYLFPLWKSLNSITVILSYAVWNHSGSPNQYKKTINSIGALWNFWKKYIQNNTYNNGYCNSFHSIFTVLPDRRNLKKVKGNICSNNFTLSSFYTIISFLQKYCIMWNGMECNI